MLSFFRATQPERSPLSNDMALPHQHNQENKTKYRKESHHSINPANTGRCNPVVNIKVNAQPQEQTHAIDRNGRLNRISTETLDDIIDRDRNADETSDGDKNLANSKHNPVQMILQSDTNKPESNGLQNEGREPERVETVFGTPDAVVAGCKVERETVRNELAVEKTNN